MKIMIVFLLFTSILYGYKLNLKVMPADSSVFINNEDYGKKIKDGILKLDLDKGEYDIKVCMKNYECKNQKIWIIDKDINLDMVLKPVKATLTVVTSTKNAIIKLDGKQIQKGEIIEFEEPKTVTIEESKDYFKKKSIKFKIELGNDYLVNMPELERTESKIKVEGKNKDAFIMIDGKKICKKSCEYKLKSGKHIITVVADGYYPFEEEIFLKNKDMVLNYKLSAKPKKFVFGIGGSYNYTRLIGGYPELDFELRLKDKLKFRTSLIYVVNFSTDSEYYGMIFSGFYGFYSYKDINFSIGGDLIFSKYIDDNVDFLLNGLGIDFNIEKRLIKNFKVSFDIINRIHYFYNDNTYDIAGKIGIIYLF